MENFSKLRIKELKSDLEIAKKFPPARRVVIDLIKQYARRYHEVTHLNKEFKH